MEKLRGFFLIEHSICWHVHDNHSFQTEGARCGGKTLVGQIIERERDGRQLRCTTASYLVANGEDPMQAKLDLRDWLRLADQVAKLAEPYIRGVIGDLE